MNDQPNKIARIEERLDRDKAGEMVVSSELGGIRFQNMLEVFEFAKLMAIADKAVPEHLRANPGACLAVCIQALEWRMSPFAVGNKSYVVKDRIAYESQLIHAVIEARAPLQGRLRHDYQHEGEDRICVVTGWIKGEQDPFVWKSPPIGKITPKNSPEWRNNPDKQLYYHTVRDWCRVYCPDVLLGIYSRDELAHVGPEDAKDASPRLLDRLPGRAGDAGFMATHGQGEAEGEPGAAAAAGLDRVVAEDGKEPTNEAEYIAHATLWLRGVKTKKEAKDRWKAERKLRTACNVNLSGQAIGALQADIEKLP